MKGFSHKQIDFDWLSEQAVDDRTLKVLEQTKTIRQQFITSGSYPRINHDIILALRHATLATTLNGSYSTLLAYQEMFLQEEHTHLKAFRDIRGAVIDVGANEGLYALDICHSNPAATVYCIEPNPLALTLLRKNLQLNNVSERCHVIARAVWSKRSWPKLRYLPFVTTNAALDKTTAKSQWLTVPWAKTVRVRAAALDDLLAPYNLKRIDIIKIDIEGSDLEALQGAPKSLALASKVVIEYHSEHLRRAIIHYLKAANFKLVHETRNLVHDTPSCGNLYFVKAYSPGLENKLLNLSATSSIVAIATLPMV